MFGPGFGGFGMSADDPLAGLFRGFDPSQLARGVPQTRRRPDMAEYGFAAPGRGDYLRRAGTSPFRSFFGEHGMPDEDDVGRWRGASSGAGGATPEHPSPREAREARPPAETQYEEEAPEDDVDGDVLQMDDHLPTAFPAAPTAPVRAHTTLVDDATQTPDDAAEPAAPATEGTQTTEEVDPFEHEELSLARVDAVRASAQEVAKEWHARAFVAKTAENAKDVKKARIHYTEGMLQQVLKLDAVDCQGNETIRQARRQAVRDIEECVAMLNKFAVAQDEA